MTEFLLAFMFFFNVEGASHNIWISENNIEIEKGKYGNSEQNRKPCCFPDQWEGSINAATNYATSKKDSDVIITAEHVAFDYTNTRWAGNYTAYFVRTKEKVTIRVLEYYSMRKSLIIMNNSCTITENDGIMEHCIPDHATSHPQHTLGSGTEQLTVDTWTWHDAAVLVDYEARMIREACVPFRIRRTSSQGSDILFSSLASYNKLSYGISDPAVFFMPPQCRVAMQATFNDLPQYIRDLLLTLQLFRAL